MKEEMERITISGGMCHSLTASRPNADAEFIARRAFILSSRIRVNRQKPSQLDNYHRRIRTGSFYCQASPFLSLSLSLSLLPRRRFSAIIAAIVIGATDLLVKSRKFAHCLSSESGVVAQKYHGLVDSHRVASRITVTYRARINPRRLRNLSLFSPFLFVRTRARICRFLLSRVAVFFFSSLSFSLVPCARSFLSSYDGSIGIDVTHASRCL